LSSSVRRPGRPDCTRLFAAYDKIVAHCVHAGHFSCDFLGLALLLPALDLAGQIDGAVDRFHMHARGAHFPVGGERRLDLGRDRGIVDRGAYLSPVPAQPASVPRITAAPSATTLFLNLASMISSVPKISEIARSAWTCRRAPFASCRKASEGGFS